MTCHAMNTEYEDCLLPSLDGPIALDGDPKDWPLHERPMIYVAGYFSANPMHGTRNAVEWAERLLEAGWLPFVPHTSIIYDIIAPHTPEFYYEYDLAMLARCDAMFVCPDPMTKESTGVQDIEILFCSVNKIPVYYEVVEARDRYQQ